MNLPNKLTVLRVVLIPFFMFFMLTDIVPGSKWIALIIFVVASLTDYLDGHLARKWNLVTNFGKFMDPLADKILVITAMILLVGMDEIPSWVVAIIIAREFIISGFRLIAAESGKVIAAGWWGKVKTAVTMTMLIYVMGLIALGNVPTILTLIGQVLIYISLALTVISLIDYLVKNPDVLKDGSGE